MCICVCLSLLQFEGLCVCVFVMVIIPQKIFEVGHHLGRIALGWRLIELFVAEETIIQLSGSLWNVACLCVRACVRMAAKRVWHIFLCVNDRLFTFRSYPSLPALASHPPPPLQLNLSPSGGGLGLQRKCADRSTHTDRRGGRFLTFAAKYVH